MAAKLLHSLADDNPDLKKQIGCMTGIFQLFDRQQMITAKRITGHNTKKLSPPGSSHLNSGGSQQDPSNVPSRFVTTENQMSNNVLDRHKHSTESSRPSFSSSSCSSSFSSLDCNKESQPESLSYDRIIFCDTPREQVISLPNESYQFSRSSSYHARDGSSFLIPNDAPRLSYDGRATNYSSVAPRDSFKSNLNLDSRSTSNLKKFQKQNSTSDDHVTNLNQAPGIQSRPPSVVAKLMGLEMLPATTSTSEDESAPSFSRESEAIRSSNSSKNLWRNSDSVMKPISRFPIEPAPWKQSDGKRNVKASSKKSSVYGEIEKRLKEIEFSSSGKDLRALKQILEAMQDKEEGQHSNYSTTGDQERIHTNSLQRKPQVGQVRNFESPIVIMKPARFIDKSGIPSSSIIPLNSIPSLPALQYSDSTDSKRGKVNGRTTKDEIPKPIYGRDSSVNANDVKWNKKTSNLTHASVRSQQSPKGGTAVSIKNSGSVSPRMQHKKTEVEKRSRPPTPPPDSNSSRRQSGRQQKESNFSGGRSRPKYLNTQGSDQKTEFISDSRDLSFHLGGSRVAEVEASEKSLKKSNDKTTTRSGGHNSTTNIPDNTLMFRSQKSPLELSEDESFVEAITDTQEFPSPISVLDGAAYDDHSASPVEQIVKTVKGGKPLGSDRFPLSSAVKVEYNSGLSSDINRKKFQNIENLVQKLKRLSSSHDEARTDDIASLCDNTNPDDRYISEVLLVSGLLFRDLGLSLATFQFHPSGYPINPDLFLVLEKTKASRSTKCSTENFVRDKFHRKLIFDYVNEILAQKLCTVRSSAEPWLSPRTLSKKTLNAQKLLRELCSEVHQLQTKTPEYRSEDENDDGVKLILRKDVMNRAESWTCFKTDVSGIVLDVERSIFKDLVDEVVIGESVGLKRKPVGRRRLFGK